MGRAARGRKRPAAPGAPKKGPVKKGKAVANSTSPTKAVETSRSTSTRASARLAAQTHLVQPPQSTPELVPIAKKPTSSVPTLPNPLVLDGSHQSMETPAVPGQADYGEHDHQEAPMFPLMPTSAQPSKHATQAEDPDSAQSALLFATTPSSRNKRYLSVLSSSSTSPTPPTTDLRTPYIKAILDRPPTSGRNAGHFFSTQGYTPPSHAREEVFRAKSMILPPPSHPNIDFFRNPRTAQTARNPLFPLPAPAAPIPYPSKLTDRADKDEGVSGSDDDEGGVTSMVQPGSRRSRLRLPGGKPYVSSEDEEEQDDEEIAVMRERTGATQSQSPPADKDHTAKTPSLTQWRDPFSYIPAANTQSAAPLYHYDLDQDQETSSNPSDLPSSSASGCPNQPSPAQEPPLESSQSTLPSQFSESCSDDAPLRPIKKSSASKNKTYGKGRSHTYKTGLPDPVRNVHRISLTPPTHTPTPQLDALPVADGVPDSCLTPVENDVGEIDEEEEEEGESELWSSQEYGPIKRGSMVPITSRGYKSPRKFHEDDEHSAIARGSPKKKHVSNQTAQSPLKGSPLKLSRSASCQIRLKSYVQNIRTQKSSRSGIRRLPARRTRVPATSNSQPFTPTPFSVYISQYRQHPGPLTFPTSSNLFSPDTYINPRTQYASPGKTGKGRQYARRRTPPALYPTQGDPQWEDEIDCGVSVRGGSVPLRGKVKKTTGKKKRMPKSSLSAAASKQHPTTQPQQPPRQTERQPNPKATNASAQSTGIGKKPAGAGGVLGYHSPDNIRIVQRRHVLPTVVKQQQEMLAAQKAAADSTPSRAKAASLTRVSPDVIRAKPATLAHKRIDVSPNTPAVKTTHPKTNSISSGPIRVHSTAKSLQSQIIAIPANPPPIRPSWPHKRHQSEEIAAFPSPTQRPSRMSLSIAPADSTAGNTSRLKTQVLKYRSDNAACVSGDSRQKSGQMMSGLDMTEHLMTGTATKMSAVRGHERGGSDNPDVRVNGKSQSDNRLLETSPSESLGKRKRQETEDISEDGRVSPHSTRHFPAIPAPARARSQALIPSSTQARPDSALVTPAGPATGRKTMPAMITPTPFKRQRAWTELGPVKSQAAISATQPGRTEKRPASRQASTALTPHPGGRSSLGGQYPPNTLERTEMGSSARARMTQGLEKTEVGSSAAALKSRGGHDIWTQERVRAVIGSSMREKAVGGTYGLGLKLDRPESNLPSILQAKGQAQRWHVEDSSPVCNEAHLAPDAAFTQSSPIDSSLPKRPDLACESDFDKEPTPSHEAPPLVTQTLQRLRSRSLGGRSLGLRVPRSAAPLPSPQSHHTQHTLRTQMLPSSQKTPNIPMMPSRTQNTGGRTQTQKSRASRTAHTQKATQTQHQLYSQKQGGNPFAQYRSPLRAVDA
ncbi:hypothetical protein IAR50_000522 [Cryptococcus sp. DSM 104548]